MSFVKTGDAQPVLNIIKADDDMEEQAKKAQVQVNQDIRNIGKDSKVHGNKTELNTESIN